jgi:hypothetical protein
MRALLVVLLAGCASSPTEKVMAGTLSLELRGAVDVFFFGGNVELSGFRDLPKGVGDVLDPAASLRANLRIEEFPEAATTLYVARLVSGARPSGPCGAEKVSLALSLARREGNRRVGGALTAYCGADQWSGVPARVLRLSGNLADPPAR